MVLEYKNIKLGNRNIKVRNWKVKDRDEFKKLIKNAVTQEDVDDARYKTLLFNVLENEIALNKDEMEYLFLLLRARNIGEKIIHKFKCDECNKIAEVELKILDILKVKFGSISNINRENFIIELQDVQNAEFYNNKIKSSESPLLDDLILHIKSINGDETKGFDEIKKISEEQDVQFIDNILDEFEEMIFRITSREKSVKCNHCKKSTTFMFDEIPNLIPSKWLAR